MSKDETQTITNTLRKLIIETVENIKPTAIFFGTITRLSPLKIQIDAKLIIPTANLVLTETVKMKELKVGDEMILIRKHGGQKFVVVDRM
jgi:hypothetical protein